LLSNLVIHEDLILLSQVLLFLDERMRRHESVFLEKKVLFSFFSVVYVVFVLVEEFVGAVREAFVDERLVSFLSTVETLFASEIHLTLLRTSLLINIQFKIVHKFVILSFPLKV